MTRLAAIVTLIAACSHAPAIKDGVVDCAAQQAQEAVADLQVLVSSILAGAEWKEGLEALALKHGEAAVTCSVAAILAVLQGRETALDAAVYAKVEHGHAWMASRPYRVAR
jgi:hypothetical protein